MNQHTLMPCLMYMYILQLFIDSLYLHFVRSGTTQVQNVATEM